MLLLPLKNPNLGYQFGDANRFVNSLLPFFFLDNERT
jgi:hypothetical protein